MNDLLSKHKCMLENFLENNKQLKQEFLSVDKFKSISDFIERKILKELTNEVGAYLIDSTKWNRIIETNSAIDLYSKMQYFSQALIDDDEQYRTVDKELITLSVWKALQEQIIFEFADSINQKNIIDECDILNVTEVIQDYLEQTMSESNYDKTKLFYCLVRKGLYDINDIFKQYSDYSTCYEEIKERIKYKNYKDILHKRETELGFEKTTIQDVDVMSGLDFEHFITELFNNKGYNAYTTKASGDQGIDVIAEKFNEKIGIQAKCYTGNVSNTAIQEVVAGKNYYNVNTLMVITNAYFTKSAIELAFVNNVELWDRDKLIENL